MKKAHETVKAFLVSHPILTAFVVGFALGAWAL